MENGMEGGAALAALVSEALAGLDDPMELAINLIGFSGWLWGVYMAPARARGLPVETFAAAPDEVLGVLRGCATRGLDSATWAECKDEIRDSIQRSRERRQ